MSGMSSRNDEVSNRILHKLGIRMQAESGHDPILVERDGPCREV